MCIKTDPKKGWAEEVQGTLQIFCTALDDKFQTDKEVLNPSWPKIFYSISFFSGQYWLSGLLDNLQVYSNVMAFVLCACSACIFPDVLADTF